MKEIPDAPPPTPPPVIKEPLITPSDAKKLLELRDSFQEWQLKIEDRFHLDGEGWGCLPINESEVLDQYCDVIENVDFHLDQLANLCINFACREYRPQDKSIYPA